MAKKRNVYICQNCGHKAARWEGKCPSCQTWNSFAETVEENSKQARSASKLDNSPIPLDEVNMENLRRIPTCYKEFDRVLGGGIVPGGLILIGGEPGIGKSTILLKVIGKLAESLKDKKVLYVSGEESVSQIKARAERLEIDGPQILLYNETYWENIHEILQREKIEFLVIDSIQTTVTRDLESAPGTLSQIRDVTYNIMNYCKHKGITTFVIGHITKDGHIAGPKVLEHMVDTVIYFEGDQLGHYRMLRAVKNRYGNTNEVGIFEMTDKGLHEVRQPTQIFLQDGLEGSFGKSITTIIEGSRSLFLEVQALVVENNYGNGRRTTQGYDSNRLAMIVAIIEKYLGVSLNFNDIYLNIVGGIKVQTRETDLSVLMSLLSSLRAIPLDPNNVYLAELGLTGEIRTPSNMEMRLKEIEQLNYKRVITSKRAQNEYSDKFNIEIIGLEKAQDIDNII